MMEETEELKIKRRKSLANSHNQIIISQNNKGRAPKKNP